MNRRRVTGQPGPRLPEPRGNVVAIDRWRTAHGFAKSVGAAFPMPVAARLLRLALGGVLLALGARAFFSPLPHTAAVAVAGLIAGGYFAVSALLCRSRKR